MEREKSLNLGRIPNSYQAKEMTAEPPSGYSVVGILVEMEVELEGILDLDVGLE